jgi:hypothetical protein
MSDVLIYTVFITKIVDLYVHSSIRLYGVVVNYVAQGQFCLFLPFTFIIKTLH